jgi:hypothetical protein
VLLEPDALGGLDCLSAIDRERRLGLLREAVSVLAAEPGVSVYLDGGHARWLTASEIAARLGEAGVADAQGFALNVSNFVTSSDNAAYGAQVAWLTGGKHFVVDTSRNGLGPAPDGDWCNPPGRALGPRPGSVTGVSRQDANLWVKRPGESDGPCPSGPAARRLVGRLRARPRPARCVLGGRVALRAAGARLGRLGLAVLRRRGRHELVEQPRRRRRDRLDRAVERVLVGLRRLRGAADLAHVLQRGVVRLLAGRGRLEVVEGADVSAHALHAIPPRHERLRAVAQRRRAQRHAALPDRLRDRLTSLPLLRSGMELAAVVPIALASDTISIAIMEVVDNAIMLLVPGAMDVGPDDVRRQGCDTAARYGTVRACSSAR